MLKKKDHTAHTYETNPIDEARRITINEERRITKGKDKQSQDN